MGQLGNIFDDQDAPAGEARGPDLHYVVEVPRNYLGDPEGFVAEIPLQLEHGDEIVRRAAVEGDGEEVPLHLPEGFPSGGMLRLRRQGGVVAGSAPGDLFIKVEIVEPEPRALQRRGPDQLRPPLTPWLVGASLFVGVAATFVLALLRC